MTSAGLSVNCINSCECESARVSLHPFWSLRVFIGQLNNRPEGAVAGPLINSRYIPDKSKQSACQYAFRKQSPFT